MREPLVVAHWAACGFFAFARWKNDWSSCALADTMPNSSPIIVDWADAHTECLWSGTWIQRQIQNGKLPFIAGLCEPEMADYMSMGPRWHRIIVESMARSPARCHK